jgi:2-dehydropantoate 2-reductase
MRIAVVGGAGAIGSIFGAGVAEAGNDTVLIDVAQTPVDVINARGLTIVDHEGRERIVRVRATTDPASVGPVDLVVMLVKCYRTDAAARLCADVVDSGTIIASLQNGLGNEEILAEHFGPRRIVAGVTYNAGTVLADGVVAHTDVGRTILGPFQGAALDHATAVQELLASAGLEAHVSREIFAEIWKKLVINASLAPASALTGSHPGALDSSVELVEALAREAVDVARGLGHNVDPEERVQMLRRMLANSSGAKGSMTQDFEANRKTEIDAISGAIARAAEQAGMSAPLNKAMFALVKAHEHGRGVE